jgi:hypothetical protein
VPLRRSRAYRAVRRRITSSQPTDTWQEDDLHYFAFTLRDDVQLDYTPFDPAVAVFIMAADARRPISAVTVEPDATGQNEVITDLLEGRAIWSRLKRWARAAMTTVTARWTARRAPGDRWLPGTIQEPESSR